MLYHRLAHGTAARVMGASLLVAMAILRCTPFSDGRRDDTNSDASTPSQSRTGVACGSPNVHCKVAEVCCGVYNGGSICAPGSCDGVDGAAYAFECGQKSDCNNGEECCFSVNGSCATGYPTSSRCLKEGLCQLCGDGGNGALGCDPNGNDCPPDRPCTRGLPASAYTACAL
jgi:hypothetical protein